MTIPPNADDRLAGAVSLLQRAPRTLAAIEGHTDSSGDPSSNRIVSYARAAAVRDYLQEQGIEPRRLRVFVFGAEKPLDSNLTAEGRSNNSRVVVRVFDETAQ